MSEEDLKKRVAQLEEFLAEIQRIQNTARLTPATRNIRIARAIHKARAAEETARRVIAKK